MNIDKNNGDDAAPSVLIIGAGIAGLYTALKLAPLPVTLVTAGPLGLSGSSPWAQGGLAAAMAEGDSPEAHLADTVAAGAGLVDEAMARILCEEGPAAIHDLINMGVPFDRDVRGQLKLGREAAHGQDRIVHVRGDEAGATIMRVLTEQALAAPHITLYEKTVAYQLLKGKEDVIGAALWDIEAQRHFTLTAPVTLLATGGVGGLYAVTTNPIHAQGQGLAMAYEADAVLRDLEFVQFHPTGIDIGRDPAPLATEALRGAGATLHDAHGHRFMVDLHPDAELGPRDIVARGVADAIARTGKAYLDATEALGERFEANFPTVYNACREAGIDPSKEQIPIAPAAHYHMGGILTDANGQSSVSGLYAVGEVASTGVHGANRLASNSLLEALVFGARAATAIKNAAPSPLQAPVSPPVPQLPIKPAKAFAPARQAMAKGCGLLRDEKGVQDTLTFIDKLLPETEGDRLAALTARLMVKAALVRQESRGAHQRTDYPSQADPCHTHLSQKGLFAA
ncbi:MAG: L-aspartate oxidase [Pseudomonadota bacterium]